MIDPAPTRGPHPRQMLRPTPRTTRQMTAFCPPLRTACLALALAAAPLLPAAAQSLFAPAATIDERVVTEFELQQRIGLLELFNAPDRDRETALDALIRERLQLEAAKREGIAITDEELVEGMTEFAGRAELTLEAFLDVIEQAGVDPATYTDFIRAGIAWRKVIRARFGEGRVEIAPDEIERAADAPPRPELQFLLNEIILPANTPQALARAEGLSEEIAAITDEGAFRQAARSYSASTSRARGGAIDWLPAANLPAPIREQILSLAPGEVTQPISIPNAVAFFQLREVGEIAARPEVTALEYAALYIPGGRSPAALAEAARVDAAADTCDDLYGIAKGLPPERLQRDTLPPAQVPADVALELAKLDPGEASVGLTRAGGQTLVFLMLCDRSYRPVDAPEPDLSEIARELTNARVSDLAGNYLDELAANATIVVK